MSSAPCATSAALYSESTCPGPASASRTLARRSGRSDTFAAGSADRHMATSKCNTSAACGLSPRRPHERNSPDRAEAAARAATALNTLIRLPPSATSSSPPARSPLSGRAPRDVAIEIIEVREMKPVLRGNAHGLDVRHFDQQHAALDHPAAEPREDRRRIFNVLQRVVHRHDVEAARQETPRPE